MNSVRLSVLPWQPGSTIEHGIDWTHPLLDIVEDQQTALDRMIAWSDLNGCNHLQNTLSTMLSNPPTSGFAVVVDDPAHMLITVRWDWCTEEHPLGHV